MKRRAAVHWSVTGSMSGAYQGTDPLIAMMRHGRTKREPTVRASVAVRVGGGARSELAGRIQMGVKGVSYASRFLLCTWNGTGHHHVIISGTLCHLDAFRDVDNSMRRHGTGVTVQGVFEIVIIARGR